MNKKRLYESIMNNVAKLVKKALNEAEEPKQRIIATNRTIKKLVLREIEKYGPNADLNHIDTSRVTNMSYLFCGCNDMEFEDFNGDISLWDVSNVTNMDSMFWGARAFNQPIGDWDVSNVTNMNRMFCVARDFNQPIGDWDVSNVTDMREMFGAAVTFNLPIGDWDVSNVTKMDKMFAAAVTFNLPIGDWDVSNVNSMEEMFRVARNFNQPIGDWDVSNVTNMKCMFDGAYFFNLNISAWNISDMAIKNNKDSNMFSNDGDTTMFRGKIFKYKRMPEKNMPAKLQKTNQEQIDEQNIIKYCNQIEDFLNSLPYSEFGSSEDDYDFYDNEDVRSNSFYKLVKEAERDFDRNRIAKDAFDFELEYDPANKRIDINFDDEYGQICGYGGVSNMDMYVLYDAGVYAYIDDKNKNLFKNAVYALNTLSSAGFTIYANCCSYIKYKANKKVLAFLQELGFDEWLYI